MEIGSSLDAHFWNIDVSQSPVKHIDLTWRQFAAGAQVTSLIILDRRTLNDSPPTVARCERLPRGVLSRLGKVEYDPHTPEPVARRGKLPGGLDQTFATEPQ